MTDEQLNAKEFKAAKTLDIELTKKLPVVPIFLIKISKQQDINKEILSDFFYESIEQLQSKLKIPHERAIFIWDVVVFSILLKRGLAMRLQFILQSTALILLLLMLWDTNIIHNLLKML